MMRQRWLAGVAAVVLTVWLVVQMNAADPGVALIGVGEVAGSALDVSGLAGTSICVITDPSTCIDQATLGGFGSAFAYTGFDNVFLAVPDRGPFDGRTDVPYRDRFHLMQLTVNVGAPFPNIGTRLLATRFLKDHGNQDFVGDSSNFAQRFDPEGVVVGRSGTFFVSDEYGPSINEFNRQGHLLRQIPVPAKFLIDHPSGEVDGAGNSLELYPTFNLSGRQANRGMEGLAITPDGRSLVGVMQNALIQDNGLNSNTPPGRVGVNTRILKVDLVTGQTWEYAYVVDNIGNGRGVNDLLAINDHQFLAVERDNRSLRPTPPNAPQAPIMKRIYKIELNGATDVSGVASLPAGALPPTITPVTKTLFIDLLDPTYKVDAVQAIKDVIAEKIEGLAWGPDLPDGRQVLYVVSDNDLFPGLPTQIYAFAVNGSAAGANITYRPQRIDGPLFPPGQAQKIPK